MPILCHFPQDASCVVPDDSPRYYTEEKDRRVLENVTMWAYLGLKIQTSQERMELILLFKIG